MMSQSNELANALFELGDLMHEWSIGIMFGVCLGDEHEEAIKKTIDLVRARTDWTPKEIADKALAAWWEGHNDE